MNVKTCGILVLLFVSMTISCSDDPGGIDVNPGNPNPVSDMTAEADMEEEDMSEADMEEEDMSEADMEEEDMTSSAPASMTGTWEVSLTDTDGMAATQIATITFTDETEVGGPELLAYLGTFTMADTDAMGAIDMAQLAEMDGISMLSVAWDPMMDGQQVLINMAPYNDGGDTDDDIIRGTYVNISGIGAPMIMTRQE
ncbi:MAG: hypothetical protein AAGI01_06560 [Myxococcota bacterium]